LFHLKTVFCARGVKEQAVLNISKRLQRDLTELFGEADVYLPQAELLVQGGDQTCTKN
jgi:hypothetical protein